MAKHAQILFGSQSETVLGKRVEDAKEKALNQIQERRGKVTQADRDQVEEMVKSQCTNEKDILKILFQTYASKCKKSIDALIEVSDLLKMVDKADLSIQLTEHEVDMLKEAIKALSEIPEPWTHYGDLFRQLKEPDFKDIVPS